MDQLLKRPETLQLQSYKILKEGIIKGEYSSEGRITEAGLARNFGVSRGTIRESVKMLIQEGLIVQNEGALMIFKPTLDTALDLYYCRERLESLAARLAAERMTELEIAEISYIIKETEKALKDKDKVELSRLNTEFHRKIIENSHNTELSMLMSNITDKVAFIRNHLNQTNIREEGFLDEHKSILTAIKDRNSETAEQEMSNHIKRDLEAVRILYSTQDNR